METKSMIFFEAVCMVLGLVCFVTSVLDMGMNGSSGADWAPWGLGIAAILGIIVWIV